MTVDDIFFWEKMSHRVFLARYSENIDLLFDLMKTNDGRYDEAIAQLNGICFKINVFYEQKI